MHACSLVFDESRMDPVAFVPDFTGPSVTRLDDRSCTQQNSYECLLCAGNPIASHPRYRSVVLHHLPWLRVLDSQVTVMVGDDVDGDGGWR